MNMDPTESHLSCVFNGLCDLALIHEDIGHHIMLVKADRPPILELQNQTRQLQSRLDHWKDSLPDCIAPGKKRFPHVTGMQ